MLTNILYLSVSILFCSLLWRVVLGFFMTQLGMSYKMLKRKTLHYLLICFYIIFAYIIGMYCAYGTIEYLHIIYDIRIQDSIVLIVCSYICFMLLHILSMLDFYTQRVPNILLAILFICANILYYLTHHYYDSYPFSVLGIIYGVYFMLHLVGRKQYIGEGDVWIIASLTILLESFFLYQISFIFEVLCLASMMGIFFYYYKVRQIRKKIPILDSKDKDMLKTHSCDNNPTSLQMQKHLDYSQTFENKHSKINLQIPFIPFLSLSFLCVSVYHVA